MLNEALEATREERRALASAYDLRARPTRPPEPASSQRASNPSPCACSERFCAWRLGGAAAGGRLKRRREREKQEQHEAGERSLAAQALSQPPAKARPLFPRVRMSGRVWTRGMWAARGASASA